MATHSFIDSLVLYLPSFLRFPSSLLSSSLKSLFLPTKLPPGYLPSIPSPFFQAVRILSTRSHTDTYFSPLHTPYLAKLFSAQQQQQQRNCPSTAADLSLPKPSFPPPLSAWLPDWVVSICPRSDWLFSFCWKPWVLDPFTANQRLQLPKSQPQHSALAVNTPVECSRITPGSESIVLGRREKEQIKEFKTSVKTGR